MGGDGGATVKRDIIVNKAQKRGLQQDIRLTNHGKTTNCALSGLPLKRPIAACEFGLLYNKEAVLTFLLEMVQLKSDKTPLHELSEADQLSRTVLEDKQIQFAHITKLGDLLDCVVTLKDDSKATAKGSDSGSSSSDLLVPTASYVSLTNDGIGSAQDVTNYIMCPILSAPLDGSLPSVVMRSCGCVMSLKGIDQINGMSQRVEVNGEKLKACCLCLTPFPPRYQDDFKPLVESIPVSKQAFTQASEAANAGEAVGKKKGAKKQTDKEKLLSFPLQDGEEPFIHLIPPEEQFIIQEKIMLAKRKHLGRELPGAVQESIKRQRLNRIEQSVDAQRWVQLDSIGGIQK